MAKNEREQNQGGTATATPPPLPAWTPPVASPEHTYVIGLTKKCPVQNVVIAGREFSKFTEDPQKNPLTGLTERPASRGRLVTMADDWLDRVKARAREHIVRGIGVNSKGEVVQGEVLDMRAEHFRRQIGDRLLTEFIYVVEPAAFVNRRWDDNSPCPPTIDPPTAS